MGFMFRRTIKKNQDRIVNDVLRNANDLVDETCLDMERINVVNSLKENYLSNAIADSNAALFEQRALGTIGVEIYKSYLPVISQRYSPIDNCKDDYYINNGIAYFTINKWVQDSEEKSLDKLINVYQTLSDEACNIALIYDRDHEKCTVTLAVVSFESNDRVRINELAEAVYGALKGNFPGVEIQKGNNTSWTGYGTPKCLKYDGPCQSVASISNIPSEKSEDYISQSMEKLLDGVIPEEGERYTIVLLATPTKMQEQRKLDLYEKYSEIAHLASFESNMTINDSRSASKNTTLGENAGVSHGWSLLLYNRNYNYGTSFSKAVTDSYQLGKSEGMTRSYVNYGIKHTLENLELQTKRLEEATALGLWDFSAYVISGNPTLTRNVAHTYLSLTQGSDSYIGKAAVNIWNYDKKEELDIILKSLSRLRHPSFVLNESAAKENNDLLMYPTLVDTTVELSGKELAFALNFPRKSISGLPVLESAAFGREVQKYDLIDSSSESISIGNVVHMRHTELQEVNLDLNSLTAHAFVTGSTGAGKTNSILQILSKAEEKGTKYLIIEPAKGEYKGYIGGKCKVYGTNPRFNELIKLNPFSFPENISVMEHIDRLVEILNACWPMYAAMPAILKDAIEKTYVNKGWDLNGFSYLPDRFPTFIDLLEALPEVINDSSYSADTQSDYKGALITRVKSLTNGINGQIICAANEISPEELFRENVIIDLSRVSSTETKALLMGVMVMKLQEYNINKGSGAFTKELKHLTVLEEAHNLLRKTSTEQSQESSNLQGKSVEMISNAIAEMRAYGEGFIIADQAPDLLDESVIRNTNTKIVLRLPDNNDRECVGKAAALKDNQIDELAKLPKGVAAVYQNDWVEAVLCQFKEFTDICPMKEVMYVEPQNQKYNAAELLLEKIYMDESSQFTEDQIECIRKWIESLRFGDYTKRKLRFALMNDSVDDKSKQEIAYNLFDGRRVARILMDAYDNHEGIEGVREHIRKSYNIVDPVLIDRIRNYVFTGLAEQKQSTEIVERYGINVGIRR